MTVSLQKTTGLDIRLDTASGALTFGEGIVCPVKKEKRSADMRGLLLDEEMPDCLIYRSYPDIYRKEDLPLLRENDMLYGITVILARNEAGECFKTSGHEHGLIPGSTFEYPEIYEVLYGEVTFVMAHLKDEAPLTGATRPAVSRLHLVTAHAGEAVVIPPFCLHGSVNTGADTCAFSNIAAGACPLLYDRVRALHGLPLYLVREKDGSLGAVKNEHYGPVEQKAAHTPRRMSDTPGIRFESPVYTAYLADPASFDFLNHPETVRPVWEGLWETHYQDQSYYSGH